MLCENTRIPASRAIILNRASSPHLFNLVALDAGVRVFSHDIPTSRNAASSVDIEHAFSFGSSTVSKCRHYLVPATIEATALLGSYSKAGLVQPGILVLPPKGTAAATTAKGAKAKPMAKH
ncbi:hypothetical protein BDV93DRAFT_458971 [Ceratobasidium sp. AG-I]|nr:hypothetical protein BDV93DRAFT_458971 [Ceratobasidium sp. AG-I]